MKNDTTIEAMMQQLDEYIAWFQGDEFTLDDAQATFEKMDALAGQIEERLQHMKHTVEMLQQPTK